MSSIFYFKSSRLLERCSPHRKCQLVCYSLPLHILSSSNGFEMPQGGECLGGGRPNPEVPTSELGMPDLRLSVFIESVNRDFFVLSLLECEPLAEVLGPGRRVFSGFCSFRAARPGEPASLSEGGPLSASPAEGGDVLVEWSSDIRGVKFSTTGVRTAANCASALPDAPLSFISAAGRRRNFKLVEISCFRCCHPRREQIAVFVLERSFRSPFTGLPGQVIKFANLPNKLCPAGNIRSS